MNPTEGKLTEAQIEMLIAQARAKEEANLSNVVIGLDDFKVLCDMALESLKAPAVPTCHDDEKTTCETCEGAKNILVHFEGCNDDRLHGHCSLCYGIEQPCPSCTVKAPAVTTGERPPRFSRHHWKELVEREMAGDTIANHIEMQDAYIDTLSPPPPYQAKRWSP